VGVNITGKHSILSLAAVLLCSFSLIQAGAQESRDLRPDAEQLMALANQARAAAGAPPLHWDSALAEAALKHTLRMVAEGPIAHQYPGELSVSERAGFTGAHFDLIEENVAVGGTPAEIHDEWMHSQGHRENMLNPQVDRVGFAVVASRGVLYATGDYARGVQQLSQAQVEAQVAALIRSSGVHILADAAVARSACMMENGMPRSAGATQPTLILRWQDSEMKHLPKSLADQLASGKYREAAVGSCEPSGAGGTFTAYRVAVLLY
jgi:hypothetical protein